MVTEISYVRGTRSAAEVQREIDSFWDAIGDDELRREVTDAGIDVSELAGLNQRGAISVTAKGSGIDPGTVALVVSFAPAANAVLVSLWKKVILPRIRRDHGRDAIGPERRSEHEP